MNKDIFLTNNLSNKKEKFVPIDENNVGMYVCGPTVYDDPHIGNARPLVIFDILFKILKSKFSSVNYVRNITDVDDKIIKSSNEKNISISDLTETVIKSLGISITDSKNKKGVLVSKVNDENINLKKGDKILEVNREMVDSTKTFISLVDKYEQTGRSSLLLKIQRDEETSWVTLKFINW